MSTCAFGWDEDDDNDNDDDNTAIMHPFFRVVYNMHALSIDDVHRGSDNQTHARFHDMHLLPP